MLNKTIVINFISLSFINLISSIQDQIEPLNFTAPHEGGVAAEIQVDVLCYDTENGQLWDMVTYMQYVDDVYISE